MKLSYTDLAKAIAESGPDNMALNPPSTGLIPPEPSYLERLRDQIAMRLAAGYVMRNGGFIDASGARYCYDGADAMLAERGKR
jgi:hypothetical protein